MKKSKKLPLYWFSLLLTIVLIVLGGGGVLLSTVDLRTEEQKAKDEKEIVREMMGYSASVEALKILKHWAPSAKEVYCVWNVKWIYLRVTYSSYNEITCFQYNRSNGKMQEIYDYLFDSLTGQILSSFQAQNNFAGINNKPPKNTFTEKEIAVMLEDIAKGESA